MSLFSRFKKAPPPSRPEISPQQPTETASTLAGADAPTIATPEEEMLRTAIAVGDTNTIARFVVDGTSTKVRQLAAEAIEDADQIRALLRTARNDKSVHKILAHKRDALLAAEREHEKIQAEIAAAAAALERHSHRPFDALFTPTLEQLESRWNVVASHAAADVANASQQAIDRAREVIAHHLRQVAAKAAEELAAANAAAAAQKEREQHEKADALAAAERIRLQEEERKAQAEKQAAEAQALRQITGLVRKAHAALASGSSKSAAGMRRAIEEKLPTVPHLPAHLAKQLKQLDAKLDELKDWKSFSVAPKRIELIERMEALIGADMHPTALAGQIKDLQEQWRTLSKGAGQDTESDWERFHEAAQKAFQPCREFFAEQDRIKEENLQQRAQVYERLLAFEQRQNWEEPDWKTAITAVREAKQLWRQHSPVDMAACEELQRKFYGLTDSLQTLIDAEYAHNVKQKQSLIERARALSSSADSRAAIDEVKRLQEKWKSIGPVPRDDDRKLWEQFRAQCDAVFQKRQEERASHTAQLETNKVQAVSVCEELENIAQLSGSDLLEGAKKIPELRAAFDAIEDLPKANARQLRERFERALQRCRKAVDQQHAQDAERSWLAALEAGNRIRAYQLATARTAAPDDVATLKQTAEESLAQTNPLPKRALEALRNALASNPNGDLAANELALKTLCIRAEILTDSPTPEADQGLRREIQVKRLMEAMGQGAAPSVGELDALTIEWLRTGPVDDAVYSELVERFKQSRSRALRG